MRNKIYQEPQRVPVNKQAALAIQRQDTYQPNKKINGKHWKDRPEIIEIPKNSPVRAGDRFGRLTVIGKGAYQNSKKRAKYVVRCDCGNYEIRTNKALQNKNNPQDRCSICWHTAYLKKRHEFITIGTTKHDELYKY